MTTAKARPTRRWLVASAAAVIAAGFGGVSAAQSDEQFTVIHAGSVITATGEEIENGTIVIVDGQVRLVGKDLDYPRNATVIDARDQVVMPGLIHSHTRANVPDYRRSGVNTHRNVWDQIEWPEIDFENYLRHGFTAVCLTASGSGIPGMSAVYRTAGPEESRLLSDEPYLRVTMTGGGKATLRGAFAKAKTEIEKAKKAREEWDKKQAEKKKAEEAKPAEPAPEEKPPATEDDEKEPGDEPADEKPEEFKPPAIDPAHQRIVDLIKEEASYPLLLELGDASGVLHAQQVMEQYDKIATRFLLTSGFRGGDYHYAASNLGESEAHVLINPGIQRVPQTTTRINLAAELMESGCDVSFLPGSLATYRSTVAEAMRFGVTREDALAGMTSRPAGFLGVADKVGTIEKGRDADLIFLDADPFAPGAAVKRVMILGEIVWEAEA